MGLFPPLDHMHSAHFVQTPSAGRGKVGPDEWIGFLDDVGIDSTVLYPTVALAYGKIVSHDWAIAVTRAYNDWLHQTYLRKSPRFRGMALIPMQEPEAAVEELRRVVEELGMHGAILPSMGLPNHLGAQEYWPIYREAERLGCCLAVHGGCHSGMGFDHLNVYAPVHAMGHPMGIMIGLAGIVFNGIFDRFPNIKIAFLEGGVAWFLMAMERFDSSHLSHSEYQVRDVLMGPKPGEKVSEYMIEHIKAGRLYIGVEGGEPTLSYAISKVGSEAFLYSSDFPHEVTNETCKEEIEEVLENDEITTADKEAILHRNAQRFYNLTPTGH
jgi:predicted TIM-barrel fold metal-dependent hydrolase